MNYIKVVNTYISKFCSTVFSIALLTELLNEMAPDRRPKISYRLMLKKRVP